MIAKWEEAKDATTQYIPHSKAQEQRKSEPIPSVLRAKAKK